MTLGLGLGLGLGRGLPCRPRVGAGRGQSGQMHVFVLWVRACTSVCARVRVRVHGRITRTRRAWDTTSYTERGSQVCIHIVLLDTIMH